MSFNIDDLKKKIIYRSTYRGSKEMDTLLSSFTKSCINSLDKENLLDLLNLLDIEDENLFKINQGQKTAITIKKNKVNTLFKNYRYKKK